MEKSIQITPPDGYEIDEEKSSFEKIMFKKIDPSINARKELISGWDYWDLKDKVCPTTPYPISNIRGTKRNSATEKVARSNAAMNRISHILKYDERFGGEITDEEWKHADIAKYAIGRVCDEITTCCNYTTYCYLVFHTAEQRDLFLKEYGDLVKDYYMLN